MNCLVRRSVFFALNNRFCISRCILNENCYISVSSKQVCGNPIVYQKIFNNCNRNISVRISVINNSYKSIFEIDTNVKKDTLLYENNSVTFEVLKYFVVLQLVFWFFAAYYCFQSIRHRKGEEIVVFRVNINQPKWYYGIPTAFILTGIILFTLPYCYGVRSVKRLTLLTGGESVRLCTWHLFKANNESTIPLRRLNCLVGRQCKKGYVPLKMENRRFYYLIDLDGKFYEPELFDVTAGAQRRPMPK